MIIPFDIEADNGKEITINFEVDCDYSAWAENGGGEDFDFTLMWAVVNKNGSNVHKDIEDINPDYIKQANSQYDYILEYYKENR